MADEHRTSSFPATKAPPLSATEKAVLKPKPIKAPQPTVDKVVTYLKDKGFSMGRKSVWYKLGEKKRAGKPPMSFSVGAGETRHGTGAGFKFKVKF